MIRTNKINQGSVRIENSISRIQVPESQLGWAETVRRSLFRVISRETSISKIY